jgi:hypothetical protein
MFNIFTSTCIRCFVYNRLPPGCHRHAITVVCWQVFNPKQVGFPGIGVPTMQVTLVPSAVTARYYVAAIATSAEVSLDVHDMTL